MIPTVVAYLLLFAFLTALIALVFDDDGPRFP